MRTHDPVTPKILIIIMKQSSSPYGKPISYLRREVPFITSQRPLVGLREAGPQHYEVTGVEKSPNRKVYPPTDLHRESYLSQATVKIRSSTVTLGCRPQLSQNVTFQFIFLPNRPPLTLEKDFQKPPSIPKPGPGPFPSAPLFVQPPNKQTRRGC